MREADAPTAAGQTLRVEDQEGSRWEIECRGEPVEPGALIAFEPVGDPARRRGELLRVRDGQRVEWVCRIERKADGRIDLSAFAGLSTPPLHIVERDTKGAADGDRVVVIAKKQTQKQAKSRAKNATDRSAEDGKPRNRGRGFHSAARIQVRVLEVLGPAGDPTSDHRAVVWKHRVTRDFPRRARLEADAFESELAPSEVERRLDLRHLPFITVDPATARDHDDAVYAEVRASGPIGVVDSTGAKPSKKVEAGWKKRLWVAIADVAHFVPPGGAIDSEARRRGNSFYFPDRAIPMLPERLSTELCSLRPDVDRLAMVVELRLLADGRVADALFHEAVVRSHARLSYEEAAKALKGRDGDDGERPSWLGSLELLQSIAEQLSQTRTQAGALALDLPEISIQLDDTGRPVDSVLRERNPAHGLIEEAMLAANRAVAGALDRAARPTIHRVHPPPKRQRLEALRAVASRAGIDLPADADLSDPLTLSGLLLSAKDLPSAERIHTAVLRSLSQARYEARSGGHHALCFDHYLHFTSPIRRYADLEVHRTLKRLLRADTAPSSDIGSGRSPEQLGRVSIWLSARERVAVEVERDAAALACCAILRGREGETFGARVQAVSEFGLFIRLEAPVIDGLIPMRTLEGMWRHDAVDEWLVGPRSGQRFGVGDELDVTLLEVDSDRGRMAFRLAGKNGRREGKGGRAPRRTS